MWQIFLAAKCSWLWFTVHYTGMNPKLPMPGCERFPGCCDAADYVLQSAKKGLNHKQKTPGPDWPQVAPRWPARSQPWDTHAYLINLGWAYLDWGCFVIEGLNTQWRWGPWWCVILLASYDGHLQEQPHSGKYSAKSSGVVTPSSTNEHKILPRFLDRLGNCDFLLSVSLNLPLIIYHRNY